MMDMSLTLSAPTEKELPGTAHLLLEENAPDSTFRLLPIPIR